MNSKNFGFVYPPKSPLFCVTYCGYNGDYIMKSDKTDKWLWLKLNASIGIAKSFRLYKALGGIDEIYASSRHELEVLGFLKEDEIGRVCNKSMDKIAEYRQKLDDAGVFVMAYDDEDYPDMLRELSRPPLVLFGKGRRLNLNKYLCIAVVGTRNPTIYGQRATDSIASGVAANGAIIVSGMALGVDAIAHRAALKKGMPTVAVLGCGVDIVVPKSHYELYDAIVENGMIISEYPLSSPPSAYTFPERNRIIAGISNGTLVTEADIKSGSLITADHAIKQSRDVFAIPGNIDSDTSKGTNRLLQQGAFPVTSPSDITESFYTSNFEQIKNTLNDFAVDAENNPETSEAQEEEIVIPENASTEEKILLSLTVKPLTVDQISYITNITLAELNMSLLMMEVDGKIKKTQGIYYTTV